jgi:hypothetical protein
MPHSCDQIEGTDLVLLGKFYLLKILIVFSVAGRIFGFGCDAENYIPEVSYSAERGIANQLPSENSITHLNRCEECAH